MPQPERFTCWPRTVNTGSPTNPVANDTPFSTPRGPPASSTPSSQAPVAGQAQSPQKREGQTPTQTQVHWAPTLSAKEVDVGVSSSEGAVGSRKE